MGHALCLIVVAAVTDAPTIQSNIAGSTCGLNITGKVDRSSNPMITVAYATVISCKGSSLTAGLALDSDARNRPSAVLVGFTPMRCRRDGSRDPTSGRATPNLARTFTQ